MCALTALMRNFLRYFCCLGWDMLCTKDGSVSFFFSNTARVQRCLMSRYLMALFKYEVKATSIFNPSLVWRINNAQLHAITVSIKIAGFRTSRSSVSWCKMEMTACQWNFKWRWKGLKGCVVAGTLADCMPITPFWDPSKQVGSDSLHLNT